MNYRNKDGLERDVLKLGAEGKKLYKEMKPHWRRFLRSFLKPSDLGHAFVNLFVEANRISPYFTGHLDAITLAVALVSVVLHFI